MASLLERAKRVTFALIMEEASVGNSVEPSEVMDQLRYELEDHPRDEDELKLLCYNAISGLLEEGEVRAIGGSLATEGVKLELMPHDQLPQGEDDEEWDRYANHQYDEVDLDEDDGPSFGESDKDDMC